MLRFLIILFAGLLIIPRLVRLLSTRKPAERPSSRAESPPAADDPLRDLTQQDISDADYEEIPPED
jgi:hypothetical protein